MGRSTAVSQLNNQLNHKWMCAKTAGSPVSCERDLAGFPGEPWACLTARCGLCVCSASFTLAAFSCKSFDNSFMCFTNNGQEFNR